MRIRKGHRGACRAADRPVAHVQGFAHGGDHAGADSGVNQAPPAIVERDAGCTSGDATHQDLVTGAADASCWFLGV